MRNLYRDRGYYFFRVRVPHDLQDIFCCSIIKRALRTKDFKSAMASVKLLNNEFHRVIQIMKSRVLTREQMGQLVQEFFLYHLDKREMYSLKRDVKRDDLYVDNRLQECDALIEQYKKVLNENRQEYDEILENFLKARNITLEKDSFDFLKLRRDFIQALIKATEVERERVKGNFDNWFDDFQGVLKKTDASSRQAAKSKGKLLSEVVENFVALQIANNAWQPKDLKEHSDFYNQFVQIIGDKDINTYTEGDALRAYKILQKFPANWKKKKGLREQKLINIISLIQQDELKGFDVISESTLKKYLVWIRSIFNYAKVINYFADFKVKRKQKASKERDPYTYGELQKWLNSPVYTEWSTDRIQKNPERFWVPLVVLLCGMRPREVCQLYQEDIKRKEGTWFFDINGQKDKSIKTLESEREVPIHPLLIKLGFLKYRQTQEHERVFPSLVNNDQGEGYAELYNKWAGRYNRQYITQAKKKVPYSMRHNFSTFLTNLPNIKESLVDEITGHVREGETRGRYAMYSLQTKYEAIASVDYGLDFSHIKYPL